MKSQRVILLRDVKGLGEAGQVKTVRGGYARNFLVPKGLALLATPGNLRRFEESRRVREARLARIKESAERLAARLSETTVEVGILVGEKGKAFGSVKASDITERLAEKGINIEKGSLLLDGPIKAAGDYEVEVRLHPEVSATLRVKVVPKE